MSKVRQKLTVDNIKKGIRVRIGLPRLWMGVPHHPSPVIWMKGKIIDVSADKGCCTVKAKHRKYHITESFFCVVHRVSKVYNAIELIK